MTSRRRALVNRPRSASSPSHTVVTASGDLEAGHEPSAAKHPAVRMPDRILTSQAGSLLRPKDPVALGEQRAAGYFAGRAEYLAW